MNRLNKKAFTLLITILLVSICSYLTVNILQTQAFKNKTIESKYLYIQAKNHKDFLKEYLNSLKKEKLKSLNKLELPNKTFNIEAFIEKKNSEFLVDIIITAKKQNIRVYEHFTLK